MYYVEVERGVRILVNDSNPRGNKAIFMVHGWPLNHKMFEYQVEFLIANGFRCITMDIRGFGDSDAPAWGYFYTRLADDIYAIMRTINARQLVLAGFSMGGAIALRYAARHSGYRLSKLVLLAAAAPSFTKRPDYPYGMPKEDVDAIILQASKDRPQMVTDFGKKFFAQPVSESFSTWFNGLGFDASGYGTIKTAEMLRDGDLGPDLPKINVPTGIFHGVLDQICPYEFALELNKGIKDSKLYTFEKSGHGVFYDELARFNNELLNFLNE